MPIESEPRVLIMQKPRSRPVFLNLLRIHMPVTALVSIAHRLAGLLLALFIPVLLYLLQLSLQGPPGFEQVTVWMQNDLLRLSLIFPIWALLHHLLAGLRFLLIDAGIGVEKGAARTTAKLVNFGALLLAVLVFGVML